MYLLSCWDSPFDNHCKIIHVSFNSPPRDGVEYVDVGHRLLAAVAPDHEQRGLVQWYCKRMP